VGLLLGFAVRTKVGDVEGQIVGLKVGAVLLGLMVGIEDDGVDEGTMVLG